MTPHIAAIVNPRAGGGRTGRAWRLISAALIRELGPIRASFTATDATPRFLPAAALTRKALHEGAQLVIAVGGDGTLNEVVNGFFEDGALINPEAHLAVVNTGTGGDFHRGLGLPRDMDEATARIAACTMRNIDIGRLTFIADDGHQATRFFANVASFGLSGAADRAVNRARFSKFFGGAFAFYCAALSTALTYRPPSVHLKADNYDATVNVGTVAVANGRFFGGGMMVAPDAQLDDEMFDIIIMRDTTLRDIFAVSRAIYKGAHLKHPKVSVIRSASLIATPVGSEPVLLDIDGEAPGRLPARFDILPGAIQLRC